MFLFSWNRLCSHSSPSCWISLVLLIAAGAETCYLRGGGTLCVNSLLPQRALTHICVGNGCCRILRIAMSSTSTEHTPYRFTGLLRDGVTEGHETDIRTQVRMLKHLCSLVLHHAQLQLLLSVSIFAIIKNSLLFHTQCHFISNLLHYEAR